MLRQVHSLQSRVERCHQQRRIDTSIHEVLQGNPGEIAKEDEWRTLEKQMLMFSAYFLSSSPLRVFWSVASASDSSVDRNFMLWP